MESLFDMSQPVADTRKPQACPETAGGLRRGDFNASRLPSDTPSTPKPAGAIQRRKQAVHDNSRATYSIMGKAFSGRKAEILAEIAERGPGTDDAIANRLDYDHKSAVQPRISDLISEGVLVELYTITRKIDGRSVPNRVVGFQGGEK